MSGNMQHINSLRERRAKKMSEQRQVSLRMNKKLTNNSDGFNKVSRVTRKNLEAAVAASKRPGFFNYYEAPAGVQRDVKNGEMKLMMSQISKYQKEIDQLDLELQMAENKRKMAIESQNGRKAVASTMSQWFKTYGNPKPEPSSGYTTRFVPLNKVYRGYGDRKAFKTQATSMKQGRICN